MSLDLLSQGPIGSELQHFRGQSPWRLSGAMLSSHSRWGNRPHRVLDFPSGELGPGWNMVLLTLGSEVFPLPPMTAAAREELRVVLQRPHPSASVSTCGADPWVLVPDSGAGVDPGVCTLSKLI